MSAKSRFDKAAEAVVPRCTAMIRKPGPLIRLRRFLTVMKPDRYARWDCTAVAPDSFRITNLC
jgi:hypothetical protein